MKIISILLLCMFLAFEGRAQQEEGGKLAAIETFLSDPALDDFVRENNCNKSPAVFIMSNPQISREDKLSMNGKDVMIGNKNDLFYKCTESDYLAFDDLSFNGKKLKLEFSYFVKKEKTITGKAIIKKSGNDWVVKKIKYKKD